MMSTDKSLNLFLDFKLNLFDQYKKNKISHVAFGHRTVFFFRQKRIKHITKSHDYHSILLNYFFWTARIEKWITAERELSKLEMGVDNEDILNEIILKYVKKRNKMVIRLFHECSDQIEVESLFLVHDDLVEIKIKNLVIPIYCNKEVLDKLKIKVPLYQHSNYSFYLPFLSYKLPILI